MEPDAGPSNEKSTPHAKDQAATPLPSPSLPKGGGAIRGIGEKFSANPVTGTGSFNVPIYTSPGRAGFGPQLSLAYDSGSGNTPFGFGWTLALPAVTRKTDKGLPQYLDAEESDIFILSGAEDLMPSLEERGGEWRRDVIPDRLVYGQHYAIHRYRPRVEGLFARIERWINLSDPRDTFWRSISKDNTATWYGRTPESRIADPADPSRVFSWLISQSYDDKGNLIVYEYKAEDSENVDCAQANERNRAPVTRSANRYLKRVYYGNRTPYLPDLTAPGETPLPTDWCFELVLDYGEHDGTGQSTCAWPCRHDPFSSYRATFEVRTYRLCRRTLMFHHFPAESSAGASCLVRSTDLAHSQFEDSHDRSQPFYSYLLSVTQTGYDGCISNSLPPLEFKYTKAAVDETVREVDSESLENLPYGIDGSHYRWVDLNGEGLSGILTEQAGSWFYKANLSPVHQRTVDGTRQTLPRFGPSEFVAKKPSLASLNGGRQQLLDISGDGHIALVDFEGPAPGYFERGDDDGWEPFVNFRSLPVLDWRNPEMKFVDLTGDGFPDLLISEGDDFRWYKSLSTLGFAEGQCVPQALDEEKGPKLVFADSTESVFLADVSGDGLTDLVRIREGEICYWPNLGYGRFGAKVTMDHSPWFESSDLFNGRRIQLADIDGSGTADIVYFASDSVHLYFNQSGNGWGKAQVLRHYPPVDSVSSAAAMDFLGNGTACLVWSSPLPGNAQRPMRYIDLMGSQKPHLLIQVTNNLGAETAVQYAPSTKFYVADKLAGTPWVTRLPFPVYVVEQVQTYDYISRDVFVTRYTYHHGYYDGAEREFRGFARVDQYDTAEFATLSKSSALPQPSNLDVASNVPPALTKTWFHTGAFFGEGRISKYLQHEYYRESLSAAQTQAMLIDDTILPDAVVLPDGARLPYDFTGEEMREACRALRGSILRQEVYALDGSDTQDRPYSVSERNYTLEAFQPRGPNLYGVYFAHPRETIDFHYERKLFEIGRHGAADPRVTHAVTLAVDQFGNVLRSASAAYGRRYADPALSPADQAKQSTILSTCAEATYTNAVALDDAYRTPVPAESSTYELIQVKPAADLAGVTNLFRFGELRSNVQSASDGEHDVPYEDLNPTGLDPGQPYRRLIGCSRNYYRPDDMGAAAGNPRALLALGKLEPLALPGNSYKLAYTPGLIAGVYRRAGNFLLPNPASVLGSVAADGGGYAGLDGDGRWWIPSGRMFYMATAPSIPQERIQALEHFFVPRRFEDPFGNASTVDFDPYDLLAVKTTDAVGNVVAAVNDYRVLAPALITDPNGNRAAVSFDALGLVAATAVMGKPGEDRGDLLKGFDANLTEAQIDRFYNADDPHTLAAPLLGDATSRVVYDVHRFVNSRKAAPADPEKWQPAFAATIARETHLFNLAPGEHSKLQISFSYSDGYAREIQKKIQSEPGPVVDGGPIVDPRWVGSGWTIYNNKGKPVRQYEPFFSQLPVKGHQFEFGVQVGVSSILCYDPLLRVVATLHPDHTYEKVVFDPWSAASWDVNDTVLQTDPTADADVGDYFQRLPAADYSPSWYTQRATGGLGPREKDAAVKAAVQANTPALAYSDPLGRTFLTVADNGTRGKYSTRIELDIQNNQRFITDALHRKVMAYDYDIPGNHLRQASMEAGERWMLNDATGKAIRAWDSRGHNFRTAYDSLRRPTQLFVLGTDPVNSDPRTTAGDVRYEQIEYGESQPDGPALNLRTRIFQHYDGAGVVTNQGFDFKGNLLSSSRQFVRDYKALPDWSKPAPVFLPDVFVTATQYDALNRTVTSTTPDGTVVHPIYNEASLLEAIHVNLRGDATATEFVSDIDYNARGQRVRIEFGNHAATRYAYDPLTLRLVHMTTVRAGFPGDQRTVQDLAYTYDPVGNITHIQDDADIHNVIFFRNRRVDPSSDYTYDAIYRLIQASGREQLGLAAGGTQSPAPESYNDVPRIHLSDPGDGNAMGTYSEEYLYDAVGNFLKFIHRGSHPVNPGWTRSYTYQEASLLEPGKVSNRLIRTTVSGSVPFNEDYGYDAQGNMTRMPQLQSMQWDFKDQLLMTQRQAVTEPDQAGERTYYVYNTAGERVRKTTESSHGGNKKDRFYLGCLEVYREYDGAGGITLERQTVHVMDDKRRIALVETKTVDTGVPPSLSFTPAIRYQFDNHLGSACLELNEAAAVITYEEYYPYGSTSYQAGRTLADASVKRYRFTGKERDDETGLYYHGARYYAPWIGRWTSCDPIGVRGGINLYEYGRGNPVNTVDREGLAPTPPEKHHGGGSKKKDPHQKGHSQHHQKDSSKPAKHTAAPARKVATAAVAAGPSIIPTNLAKARKEIMSWVAAESKPANETERLFSANPDSPEHNFRVAFVVNYALKKAGAVPGKDYTAAEFAKISEAALWDVTKGLRQADPKIGTSESLVLRDAQRYLYGSLGDKWLQHHVAQKYVPKWVPKGISEHIPGVVIDRVYEDVVKRFDMTVNAIDEEVTGKNPGLGRGRANMPHSRPGGQAWYDLGMSRFHAMNPDDGSTAKGSPFITSTPPTATHTVSPFLGHEDDKYIYYPGEKINKSTGEFQLAPGPKW